MKMGGPEMAPHTPQRSQRPGEAVPLDCKDGGPRNGPPNPAAFGAARRTCCSSMWRALRGGYCIGENEVGRQILLTTRSTRGPLASLALRAASHSGSAMNVFQMRSRSPRSAHDKM